MFRSLHFAKAISFAKPMYVTLLGKSHHIVFVTENNHNKCRLFLLLVYLMLNFSLI